MTIIFVIIMMERSEVDVKFKAHELCLWPVEADRRLVEARSTNATWPLLLCCI